MRVQALRSGNRLGIIERLVERLTGAWGVGFEQTPAVVVVLHGDPRFVLQTTYVEGGTDFILRSPAPGEFDIGDVAVLADAGDAYQFPSRRGYVENLFAGFAAAHEVVKGVDAQRSEGDFPAGRWSHVGRARRRRTNNPAAMLQDQILRRGEFLARDRARVQQELLGDGESVGSSNEGGGQAAGQKIARRARTEKT